MQIRALGEADAPAWWRLRLEALETAPLAFGRSVTEHHATPVDVIAGKFRARPAGNLDLGAFDAGELVGMATFQRETAEKARHKGQIFAVYVSATHRTRGVGRALIERVIAAVRTDPTVEQILISVATSQDEARALYRSLGFVSFGLEPAALKIGDAYVDEDHLILRLR